MYLKKIDGPRAVNLPDGSVMTRADLPPVETRRWVASRKAAVVKAVRFGLLSESQAMERYTLSQEELSEWMEAVAHHGEEALKATLVQKFRGPASMVLKITPEYVQPSVVICNRSRTVKFH